MADYPEHLVRRRFLFDGTPVIIRPIRADDKSLEQAFVRRLSEDSRYYRFMSEVRELSPRKLKYFTEIDYDRHMAFVALVERDGVPLEIGVSRYAAGAAGDTCEFAVVVDDDWQRTGVAGLLMLSLMDAARERGFAAMEGFVLAANHKMLKFARQLGFSVNHVEGEGDTLRVVRAL
jgi:acetyltransferase